MTRRLRLEQHLEAKEGQEAHKLEPAETYSPNTCLSDPALVIQPRTCVAAILFPFPCPRITAILQEVFPDWPCPLPPSANSAVSVPIPSILLCPEVKCAR